VVRLDRVASNPADAIEFNNARDGFLALEPTRRKVVLREVAGILTLLAGTTS
jgi:hypothetical protein